MSDFIEYNSDNTLEPPGTIAVLGGGPLAIETALFARYLGFSVSLYSTDLLVAQLHKFPENTTPTLLASPLGLASLAAQRGLGGTMVELDCPDYGTWINQYFRPLAEVDFLKGAIHSQVRLDRINLAQVEDDADADEDLPPDFVIEWTNGQAQPADREKHADRFEAIIDMRAHLVPGLGSISTNAWFPSDVTWLGPGSEVPPSAPDYYLCLAELPDAALSDSDMLSGFQRIQKLFSLLCDRPKLDVYGSLGGFAST